MVSLEIKKRDLYIVFGLVIILGGGFVAAQFSGGAPDPGHLISEIQVCNGTTPFLRAVSDGGTGFIWSCETTDDLIGLIPSHEFVDTSLRFENPDGTFGELVDLKGDDCSVFDTASGATISCEDGSSATVDDGADCSATAITQGDDAGSVNISCGEDNSAILKKGIQGDSGGGSTGLTGYHCWDLNQDRINDSVEDVNNDGQWTVLDCQGAGTGSGTGEHAVDGTNCDPNEAAIGVDRDGNAQGCWAPGGTGNGGTADDVVCVDCIDGSEIVDGSLSALNELGWAFVSTPILEDETNDFFFAGVNLSGPLSRYSFCSIYGLQVDKGWCKVVPRTDIEPNVWQLQILTGDGGGASPVEMNTACGAVCILNV